MNEKDLKSKNKIISERHMRQIMKDVLLLDQHQSGWADDIRKLVSSCRALKRQIKEIKVKRRKHA